LNQLDTKLGNYFVHLNTLCAKQRTYYSNLHHCFITDRPPRFNLHSDLILKRLKFKFSDTQLDAT